MADMATIEREPIDSTDLMERAAEILAAWVGENVEGGTPLFFLIGKGNNGGDGLAMARMLYNAGFDCSVLMVMGREQLSPDAAYMLENLPQGVLMVGSLDDAAEDSIFVDAIFGTGFRGVAEGAAAETINRLNALNALVVSIDIPSGMASEPTGTQGAVVIASATLSIEFPKLSMLLPDTGEACGEIEVLSIDLDRQFMEDAQSPYYYYITREMVARLFRPTPKFAHKGSSGHALLVCGSTGMAGAAVLAASGALRSGCGVVTVHMPAAERFAMFEFPSALISPDPSDRFDNLPSDIQKYSSVGVGCGLGQDAATAAALEQLFTAYRRPMIIDADALNIVAANPRLSELIPAGSILTPHPGELRRLVGDWNNDMEKIEKVLALALRLRSVVVVKGAHTMICTPDGRLLFNSTGNPGMAKGGSGDILAGLLTGLLARGYSAEQAAITGVWLHGRAGDKAAMRRSPEAMHSANIAEFIGSAWGEVK